MASDSEPNRDDAPEEPVIIEDYIPLPEELYSAQTSQPFMHCVECEKEVLHDGELYIIQKAYHGDETILEIAWCIDCHNRTQATYSKISRSRIWDFFLDRCNLAQRQKRLKSAHRCDFGKWTQHCITCGVEPGANDDRLVVASADGGDLLFYHAPYMFCGKCQDEMVNLLSNESLDSWNEWKEKHLPGPPAEAEALPDSRSLVFI